MLGPYVDSRGIAGAWHRGRTTGSPQFGSCCALTGLPCQRGRRACCQPERRRVEAPEGAAGGKSRSRGDSCDRGSSRRSRPVEPSAQCSATSNIATVGDAAASPRPAAVASASAASEDAAARTGPVVVCRGPCPDAGLVIRLPLASSAAVSFASSAYQNSCSCSEC